MTDSSIAAAVTRRSDELSAALLEREGGARSRAGTIITGAATAAAGVFDERAAVLDVAQLPADKVVVSALAARMNDALTETVGVYQRLGSESWAMSCASTGEQLTLMHPLNDAAHPRAAEWAADRARTRSADFVSRVTPDYRQALDLILGRFRTDVRAQLSAAAANNETAEQARRRVFSPDPVRLPGCAGRGVWFRTLTAVEARIVSVSIVAANEAHMDVIDAYNRAVNG